MPAPSYTKKHKLSAGQKAQRRSKKKQRRAEKKHAEDARRDPYAPCPCGGGRKFRFCHGDRKA